jgi:5'-3' exonuclease
MRSLKGKTVVIDTSIYLYKFIMENVLLENFYLFISILLKYEIKPIFIFDGRPPAEKKALLIKRLVEKREAESKYNDLLNTLEESDEAVADTGKIQTELRELKRQFVRVMPEDIEKVKKLMDAYGVRYCDAPGEADELCAFYMKSGKAWGCFSDDMDMLVYDNTTNILRGLSLLNHTVVLYNKPDILKDLEMTETDFNKIMILSGTDYNLHMNTSLKETVRWFYEYNKYRAANASSASQMDEFYTWLHKNTKYIVDYDTLLKTEQMFVSKPMDGFDNIDPEPTEMNCDNIRKIMAESGFIFCPE